MQKSSATSHKLITVQWFKTEKYSNDYVQIFFQNRNDFTNKKKVKLIHLKSRIFLKLRYSEDCYEYDLAGT